MFGKKKAKSGSEDSGGKGEGDRLMSAASRMKKMSTSYAKIDIEEIGNGPLMVIKGERGRKNLFGGNKNGKVRSVGWERKTRSERRGAKR